VRSKTIAFLLGFSVLAGAACSSKGGGAAVNGVGGAPGAGGQMDGGGDGAAVVDAAAADVTPTPPFTPTFHMGADITWVPHDEYYGATYVDTDGTPKDILALMKNHGMNSVRLRTFVDPKAPDGYDQFDGFGDQAHTVAMAQRVKQAGMGLLISMHYSDNWADPGKQCVPVAWQQDTFEQMTKHVHDYTFGLMTALRNAGATPDLVQIGNEITPGMLFSICDTYGIPTANSAVNGSASNWANLGTLLKAGIAAVKEVDPRIKTVLHIDKGGEVNASVGWIRNAQAQGVEFDVFADTSYVRWQGQPSSWQDTFTTLADMFPNLSFIIPEYGNETATSPATPSTMKLANDIIFGIAGNRGLGTWIYEPEHPAQSGIGIGLFMSTPIDGGISDTWPVFTALPPAMTVYDDLKVAYAGRL
jgi:arabinogalactan endo-1,4-beta-galactosidase